MADRLGVAPPPNLVLEGDRTSIAVQKLQKHMKSGSLRTPGEFVNRQATWPEQLLSPNAPNHGKLVYDNLSFTELMEGLLSKVLIETHPIDDEIANKLCYIRELVVMHYNFELKSVLAINKRFFQAWENTSYEWDDWSRIDSFMKDAKYQHLLQAMAQNAKRAPGPPKPGGNGGGGAGGGTGKPPKPTGDAHVNGVPGQFLKDNKICIKFNRGTCPDKDVTQHVHPFDLSLIHI